MKIELDNLELANVHFRHDLESDTALAGLVDFSHLDVKEINGNFNDFRVRGDSVFVNIDKLRFTDKSGFRLTELSAEAKVAPDEMLMHKLAIVSPSTDLHLDLTFRYDSFACFNHFLTCINFKGDFEKSRISFKDIAFFASDVRGMGPDVDLAGRFRGQSAISKGRMLTCVSGRTPFSAVTLP
jgi:hypothetical protein